jgi:hypothetical protein
MLDCSVHAPLCAAHHAWSPPHPTPHTSHLTLAVAAVASSQTEKEVELRLRLPPSCRGRELEVDFQPTSIRVVHRPTGRSDGRPSRAAPAPR